MIKILDFRNGNDIELFEKLAKRNQFEFKNVNDIVTDVLENIKKRSDEALFEYTLKFDKVILDENNIEVNEEQIEEAYRKINPELLRIIKKAKDNIYSFHKKQLQNSWFTNESEGVLLGQLVQALDTVGIYTPGGTAAYPSSVLMNAVPAKVAGVKNIIMVTPPKKEGINPLVLVAAKEAGVDHIYTIGGAQGIAALAYGTKSVPKVDKIVGPGNIYVNTAKRMVYGYCDIDMFAGPSEITIIADDTANPEFIAVDLMSQAEHDELASSILITTSEEIAKKTLLEIEKSIINQERKSIIEKSFKEFGAIIIVDKLEDAFKISNQIAPEHLELCIRDAFENIGYVKNAGAIFLGNYTPEPVGDYFAGPNHVLPTSGTSRFFSPLSTDAFIKKSSIISYSKNALNKIGNDVIDFANHEGLYAHAESIKRRIQGGNFND